MKIPFTFSKNTKMPPAKHSARVEKTASDILKISLIAAAVCTIIVMVL